jgi:PAS domain S-box-containing protein
MDDAPLGDVPFTEEILAAARGTRTGLVVLSAERIVFMNAAAEDLLGRPAAEVDPAEMAVLLGHTGPRDAAMPAGAVGPAGSRPALEVLRRTVRVGGRSADVLFLFDLAERRRAEARLADSVASFRRILDAAPDAVAVGTRRRLLYANPALARMLGAPDVARVLSGPLTDFIHPEDRARALQAIGAIVETGEGRHFSLRMVRHDGCVLSVELSAMRVDWLGEPAALAAGRDLSERRRAQTQLAGADRLSAIGTLTAGIAHEVNNPLAYVLLNLQYLLKQITRFDGTDAMTAKLIERVGEAQHGARRVRGIVADLRTLARREERSIGPISVEAAVRAAVRIAGSTFKERVRLVERYEPSPLVDANATRLEQVFVNLLVNAAQAMDATRPEHTIDISVQPEGDQVVAEVRDTGTGIPPEALGRIFDPFFTTKPRGAGTGLGLPISYQIVSSYGGELSVESTPGAGAKFRVVLPASTRPRLPVPKTPTPPPAAVRAWRAHVLVVDDEPLVTDMLKRVFGEEHDVTVTTSPVEGLTLMLKHDYDIVFCDLLMPGLSGMDLYEELSRRRPEVARRFVFMTGGAFTERAAEFLARVGNRRIVKPFEISDLERALAHVARGTR